MKQIIQMKHNVQGEESQLVGGEPGGYFTSIAQDLNPELPKTDSSGGQGGTWTQSLHIASPGPYHLSKLPPQMFVVIIHPYHYQNSH